MQATEFDEQGLFANLVRCRVRALLIGRRALVALGLPVLTADYDFWVHPDDAEVFNQVCADFDLHPTRTVAEARSVGRYVLEGDERVDVMIVRRLPGDLHFDEVWARRTSLGLGDGVVHLPSLEDLIATKRIAGRRKDLADIAMLEQLKAEA